MLKKDKKKQPANNTQGIYSKGDALRNTALVALLLLLVPVLAVLAYLITVREPELQNQQTDRVASAYATVQATNVEQLLERLGDRMAGAAKSPLALSAIASQSSKDLLLVEKAMLDYFPEVISLRLVSIGEMGTAKFEDGDQGLRNHIEVDMVRRSSQEEETKPESYKFEGRWLTSLARLVSHPRIVDKRAVIIATLENTVFNAELSALDGNLGSSNLEQIFVNSGGGKRTDAIAAAGSGGVDAHLRSSPVSGTNWRVTFAPSNTLLNSLSLNPLPMLILVGVFVFAALLSIGFLLLRYRRTLNREVDELIVASTRKSPLAISIPELVSIGKQLRRTTARSSRSDSEQATLEAMEVLTLEEDDEGDLERNFSDPLFHPSTMVNSTQPDPAQSAPIPRSTVPTEEGFPEHIFRAYDVRGHAENELDDEMVRRLGLAIGSLAEEAEQQGLIVACDGRRSSPRIKATLVKALLESGRDVIDIGVVPTPLLYFATHQLDCRSGIMITGSHNPADDNGLKIVIDRKTIAAGGIQKLRDTVLLNKFSSGKGSLAKKNVVPAYIDEIAGDIAIAMPLKIVVDAGNGATSAIAPELFLELGCDVVPLYCEIDGEFPNHPPDTSNEENLTDLIATVKAQKADFGVAFDGDGDRLAVVTSSGRIVRSDVLLMLYAQDIVSRNPGADVVFDIKCSRNLTQLVTQNGGRPVLWKTGHAYMKEKMAATGALLGGEFSGHMFFGERWFGFDDGMYAAGRLAEILSTQGTSLDTALSHFPQSINTPEILIPVEEALKFEIMSKMIKDASFDGGKINTLDGIRVDFDNGWGLLRASNTSASLTARFEATSPGELDHIRQLFQAQLDRAVPELSLTI